MELLDLIKRELAILEKTDLKATPATQLADRFRRISEYLVAHKATRDSLFTKELITLVERALEFHNAASLGIESLLEEHSYIIEPEFKTGERVYAGKVSHGHSGRKFLKIKPAYAHFSLSRLYEGTIVIEWGFGSEGRVQSIVYRLVKSQDRSQLNKTSPIIVVEDSNIECEWKEANAKYFKLPEETRELNADFEYLRLFEKFRSLLRFGYSDIKDLLKGIGAKTIKEDATPRKGEKPLYEIEDDREALYMLLAANSMRMPNVFLKEGNRMLITYS